MADEVIEGGEGEANIIVPVDKGVNNTPNAVPKDDANKKPPVQETDEDKAKRVEAEAAAKKAEEAKAAEQDPDKDADGNWKEAYIELPDPAAQSVINLLNEAGVKPVEANSFFADAFKNDDPSLIKWDLIEARLGKDKANLAKIGVMDYYNREYSKNVATTKVVKEVVGGDEAWGKVAKWVKAAEIADPSRKAEFDELRKGIDMGGRYAKQAAADLKALYEAAPGNSGLGGTKVLTKGQKTDNTGLVPLSKADYVAELQKHGDNIKPAVYAQLRAQRKAGMAAGI